MSGKCLVSSEISNCGLIDNCLIFLTFYFFHMGLLCRDRTALNTNNYYNITPIKVGAVLIVW